jgi:hypothetical protein
MEVRKFRLGELDEAGMSSLNTALKDLQTHRVRLADLDWLELREALWPLGFLRPPLPVTRIALARPKTLRR